MPRLTSTRLWLMLLAMVIAGLSARVVWHASTTETGWQFLEEQARWATIGWFIEPEPIVHRLPPEQAEFWLERTEEVLRQHPDDAEIAMGAALMLHHPDSRYMAKLVTFPQWPRGGISQPELDNDRAKKLEQEFEGLCRERSLELAELATRLEPDNLAWWRLRGYLVLPPYNQRDDLESRIPDWEEILRACAEHDPDNAFYDYLAASIHWEASGAVKGFDSNSKIVMLIHDPEWLAAGNAAFERGQTKPLLVVGYEGFEAAARLEAAAQLSASELPLDLKGTLAGHRGIETDSKLFRRELQRWQLARADAAVAEGEVQTAFELWEKTLAKLNQFERANALSRSDFMHIFLKSIATAEVHKLAMKNPGLVDADRLRALAAAEDEAELNYQAYQRAEANLALAAATPSTGPLLERSPLLHLIAAYFSRPIVVLWLIAGLLGTVGWVTGGQTNRPIGPWGYLPRFVGCLGLSIVLFGLAPAEVIGRQVQNWMFTVGLLVALSIAGAVCQWTLLSGRRLQFTLAGLLGGMFVLAILMGLTTLLVTNFDAFTTFPFQLHIPPREVGNLPTDWMGQEMDSKYPGAWVMTQWLHYQGLFVAVGLWLLILAMWQRIRDRRQSASAPEARPTWRDALGPPLRTSARAAAVVSLLVLACYLMLLPSLMHSTEAQYQRNAAFGNNPQAYYAEAQENFDQAKAELIRERGTP